jgi:hypothetical protein
MSAWMLLLALSGMHCDAARGDLSFDPILTNTDQKGTFRTLWSNGVAWGIFQYKYDPVQNDFKSSVQVLGKCRKA